MRVRPTWREEGRPGSRAPAPRDASAAAPRPDRLSKRPHLTQQLHLLTSHLTTMRPGLARSTDAMQQKSDARIPRSILQQQVILHPNSFTL